MFSSYSEPKSAECFFCNIHLFIYLLLNIKFTSFFCTTRRSKEMKEHGNVIFLCQFSSSVNQGKISVYYLYIHVFQKFKCFSFSQHGTKNKTKEIEVRRKMKYKKKFHLLLACLPTPSDWRSNEHPFVVFFSRSRNNFLQLSAKHEIKTMEKTEKATHLLFIPNVFFISLKPKKRRGVERKWKMLRAIRRAWSRG